MSVTLPRPLPPSSDLLDSGILVSEFDYSQTATEYMMIRDLRGAITIAAHGQTVFPRSARLISQHGHLLYIFGEVNKALDILAQGFKFHQNDTVLMHQLAHVLIALDQPEMAGDLLKQTTELRQHDVSHCDYIDFLARQKNFSEAKLRLIASDRRWPENIYVKSSTARLLLAEGNEETSRQNIARLSSKAPANASVRTDFAIISALCGYREDAEMDIEFSRRKWRDNIRVKRAYDAIHGDIQHPETRSELMHLAMHRTIPGFVPVM